MRHSIKGILLASLLLGVASTGLAEPSLSVTNLGANGDGNLQWRVDVLPDAALLEGAAGALSVEVGFEFDGITLLDTALNDSVWSFELPGFNPFSDSITQGLITEADQAFVSLGSDPISEMVELLTFTTSDAANSSVTWGGYSIRPGEVGGFTGARISQAGQNFDGITGSLATGGSACDPNSQGDLDGNGSVEFADFLILSGNFGETVSLHTEGDIDCNGTVEFADFLVLSANFGQSVGVASVPEPAVNGAMVLGALGCLLRRRRN